MEEERLKRLREDSTILSMTLEKVEQQISILGREANAEKEMTHLARLIYAGQVVEKVGLLYSFNEQALYEILTANKSKLEKPPEGVENL